MNRYRCATLLCASLLVACSPAEPPVVELPQLAFDESELPALYDRIANMSLVEIRGDDGAMETAHWLFGQHCASCHGVDAKGKLGVPDLTGGEWYGVGTEDGIRQHILQGRTGIMPAFGRAIGEVELGLLVSYVEYLGAPASELTAGQASGQVIYERDCVVCHADDGSGVAMLGPSLIDGYFQWGDNAFNIRTTITRGREASCPAHIDLLSAAEVELLTAYVSGLGRTLDAGYTE